jgi:hypothetical protein
MFKILRLRRVGVKRPVLTESELKVLPDLPGVLEALADHHSIQETLADAQGFMDAAKFHDKRKHELKTAAAFIRVAWLDGEQVKWEQDE